MYSDYIIYMDESGDHSLDKINAQFPIFVLSACIFEKLDYASKTVPQCLGLKFKHFGHDMIVLHSRDIRKAIAPFDILQNATVRTEFLGDINDFINDSSFVIVSAIIDKNRLKNQYSSPNSPYDIALQFCLERSFGQMKTYGQANKTTHVVVEQRGKKEDDELELVFRRVVQGANAWSCPLPFEIIFADKKTISTGLQIADLVSFPIGRNYLNPAQSNQSYTICSSKFRVKPGTTTVNGWGRKSFP